MAQATVPILNSTTGGSWQCSDTTGIECKADTPAAIASPDAGPEMTATANAKALSLTIRDKLITLADEVARVIRGMEIGIIS